MPNKHRSNPIRINSKLRNVLGSPLSKTANDALRDHLWLIGSQQLQFTEVELRYICETLKRWTPVGLNPFEKEESFKTLIIDRLIMGSPRGYKFDKYQLIFKLKELNTLQTLKAIHLVKNTDRYTNKIEPKS